MSNPFLKYTPKKKTVFIEALGVDVDLRELSLDEAMQANDMDEVETLYFYVSKALVSPKMSMKDLKGLNTEATEALKQIVNEALPKKGK